MNIKEQIREQEELLEEAYVLQSHHLDMAKEAYNNIEHHVDKIAELKAITEEPMNDMIEGLIK